MADRGGQQSNDYHFITRWHVPGAIDEVAQILGDAAGLARWWPAVYLDVQIVQPGDEQGVGKVVNLFTKGWLPYTLRWQFRVTEAQHPHTFSIAASGDFEGRGIWSLQQDGPWVDVTYDWNIRAEKPLLRRFSLVMKPIFAANHRWAMARGEESLLLELARRQAPSAAKRASIPAPPAPTSLRPLGIALIAILALGLFSIGAGAAYRRPIACSLTKLVRPRTSSGVEPTKAILLPSARNDRTTTRQAWRRSIEKGS